MYKQFIIFENLVLDHDIPKYGLFRGSSIIESVDKEAIFQYGDIFRNTILKSYVFYREFYNLDNPTGEFNYSIHASQNLMFLYGIWLIKDISVFSLSSYLYNVLKNDFKVDTRNVFLSKANGTYSYDLIDMNIIDLGHSNMRKINDLLVKERTLGKVENHNNNYSSSTNSFEYNSLTKLDKALSFINSARSDIDVLRKISWYIVAVESLFKFNEKSDLAHKLSYRVPHFIGGTSECKQDIFDTIKNGYELRSNLLHGGDISMKNLKNKSEQISISVKLDDILRKTINLIINDEDKRSIILNKASFNDFFHSSLIR